jgi:succinoglycan biosynthesis transport protein ExoP
MEKPTFEYRHTSVGDPYGVEPRINEPAADLAAIRGVIRRQWRVAVLGALLAAMVAALFVWNATPWYSSNARILLDQDRNKLLSDITAEKSSVAVEEYIATQIAVIRSNVVARRVARDLNLKYDPDLGYLVTGGAPQPEPNRPALRSAELSSIPVDQAVLHALARTISVYQVESSLVVEIAASSPDPQLARSLAEAYGRAYLDDQLTARYDATSRAGSWLESRINELRQQSLEANAEVERFRTEHDLITTDGRLVSDQQLGGLSQQLMTAKLAATQASAKVLELEEAVNRGDVNSIIGSVGTSSALPEAAPIKALRNEYLQVLGRAKEVAERGGAENAQAVALKGETQRLSQAIVAEAKRVLSGYQSDYRVAQSAVDSIQAAVRVAKGQFQSDSSTLVTLRNLEQRAQSYSALYQEYLTRYQEALQQQTLPLTTGRLVSQPELSLLPDFPKTKVIMALAIVLGFAAGGAIGVAREISDKTLRTASDVEKLNVPFLGYVESPHTTRRHKRRAVSKINVGSSETPENANRWSAAIKAIRIALEIRQGGGGKVIGITTLLPSHSKSALALALAEHEVISGKRVLLIDGDTEERNLARDLAIRSDISISNVASGQVPLDQALYRTSSGLLFLPNFSVVDAVNLADAAGLINQLRDLCDMIIIDLPPAAPISEARLIAPSVDGIVCTSAWGKASSALLATLVRSSPAFERKLLGVVLTDVDGKKLRYFDPAAPDTAARAQIL